MCVKMLPSDMFLALFDMDKMSFPANNSNIRVAMPKMGVSSNSDKIQNLMKKLGDNQENAEFILRLEEP